MLYYYSWMNFNDLKILIGYCKTYFECNDSLHHDFENQGENEKAETKESETDEDVNVKAKTVSDTGVPKKDGWCKNQNADKD